MASLPRHTAACAILTCADSLLRQGLEDLLNQEVDRLRKTSAHIPEDVLTAADPINNNAVISSDDICKLCCAVVFAQSKDERTLA